MRPQILSLAACLLSLSGTGAAERPPNILFILTDDQDWHMESMQHMPFLQKYLINEGTLYANHYCTVALCCPSRVNLWTGKAAHNTNVRIDFSATTPYQSPNRIIGHRCLGSLWRLPEGREGGNQR